jgi:hypothetical protein
MGFVVISAKNRSTRFSHDALVGVKCSLKRGCFSSQALTSGVLWVAFSGKTVPRTVFEI